MTDLATPVGRAAAFLAALEHNGYDFHAGVPCSLLKHLISRFDTEPRWGYISAVREDSAIGLAGGAWLGGRTPVVYMQNSGLGVSINALQSLSQMYELPVLLVISWRGEGGVHGVPESSTSKPGFVDAPEHIGMGDRTMPLLDLCGIPWRMLNPDAIDADVAAITATLRQTRLPVALVVRKGIFGGD